MKKLPRIFQLVNCDNDYASLYFADISVETMSDEKVIEAIEKAYDTNRNSDDVPQSAEEELEKIGIHRIYAQVASTDAL